MSKEDFTPGQSNVTDFWKFINERHSIYLKRKEGRIRPWSDDPIFQKWKFTNVFRELDRGTIALRRMLKQLYIEHKEYLESWQYSHYMQEPKTRSGYKKEVDDAYIRNQFITCILYRMFNWHENARFGPISNPTAWYKYLEGKLGNGQIIMGDSCPYSYQRECILESYIEVCREIVSDADDIILQIQTGDGIDSTLEHAWCILQEYDCIGPFIAYEFVCDLRYTDILRNATDTCTWCNIGPGAVRGLSRMGYRVNLESIKGLWTQSPLGVADRDNTHWVFKHLSREVYPYWELREIEHCLCEFDKYERIRLGQGGPRAKFNGLPSKGIIDERD